MSEGGGFATFSVAPTFAKLFADPKSIGPLLRDLASKVIVEARAFAADPDPTVSEDIAKRLLKIAERIDALAGRQNPKGLAVAVQGLQEELAGAFGFIRPSGALPPDLFELLSDLLINPTRTPGEPCLAPAPLLRDLLDLALGRASGVLDEVFGGVRETVEDFLFPAFGTAEILADSVQAVLDDPITAALNMVLGQRAKIDCVTDGALGVGIDVIGASIRRLEKELAEVLL
jgi:hypothetical protein